MDPKKAFLYTVTLVMRIKFRSYENKVPCHLMHTNYTNRYENDLLYVISNCYIKLSLIKSKFMFLKLNDD